MRKIPKPEERVPLILGKRKPRAFHIPTARLLLLSPIRNNQSEQSRATHSILDLPTDSSCQPFYFVVFRMWGAGVFNESILSKAVASALGNLRQVD